MLRKFTFGTVWFVVLYFGACIVAGAVLGAIGGVKDPRHAKEAGRATAEQFMGSHAGKLLAGSLLLSVTGAALGFLPGTRRRTAAIAAPLPAPALTTTDSTPAADSLAGADSPPVVPSPAPPAAPPRAFGVRDGLVAVAATLAAQFGVFFAIGVVAAFQLGTHATPAERTARVMELMPIGFPLGYAAAALVLFWLYRGYARRPDWAAIKDSFGLAWGTPSANAGAAGLGFLLAVLYLVLAPHIADPQLVGPTTTSAMTNGPAGVLAFAMAAVLLAPPTEELLFRGLLIRSFASRLSLPVAAFVSAALFWTLHVPETRSYWPAEIAIALLAALTTFLRFKERALGPAISGHAGYNLVVAGAVMLAKLAS